VGGIIMDFRKVFNSIPEEFDKWRTRYCDELFADVIEYSKLNPGKTALEIGPGTGQAVDSRTITNKDVKDYILLVNESFFFETDTLSLKPLDMLIDQQLLLSYARDNNIVVSKHDLSNEISEYKSNFNRREKNNT
jgi:hypothetical protein